MTVFWEIVEILIVCTVSSLAFSIFFCINPKRCFPATLGGLVSGSIYLLLLRLTAQEFLSSMVASVAAAIYCEVCARKTRAPAVIYIVPALFPLVPGSALYYTINSLVSGEYAQALVFSKRTVEIALGVACGLIVGSLVDSAVKKTWVKRAQKENQKS